MRPGDLVADNAPEFLLAERRLALAVIKQALADLRDPAEATDAIEFLTITLWADSDDPEALPFRDVVPMVFTAKYTSALLDRANAIAAGEAKPPKMEDDDGAMTYAEVAAEMVSN